jgi:hypothetical protein
VYVVCVLCMWCVLSLCACMLADRHVCVCVCVCVFACVQVGRHVCVCTCMCVCMSLRDICRAKESMTELCCVSDISSMPVGAVRWRGGRWRQQQRTAWSCQTGGYTHTHHTHTHTHSLTHTLSHTHTVPHTSIPYLHACIFACKQSSICLEYYLHIRIRATCNILRLGATRATFLFRSR